jgi:hypothetical protein
MEVAAAGINGLGAQFANAVFESTRGQDSGYYYPPSYDLRSIL